MLALFVIFSLDAKSACCAFCKQSAHDRKQKRVHYFPHPESETLHKDLGVYTGINLEWVNDCDQRLSTTAKPESIPGLLTTTCPQPCTNCVPQQRQYQYVVNVPLVPVQGVAVPSNNPQGPCCNGAVPGQQATQLIWYSAGNGQQNSGMLSNFTAISTQNGFSYQNPTGGSPPPGYITPGYSGPSTPIPTQAGQGFTSPPPNYNPNVYLQPTTPPPGFTGQTVGPTGVPIMQGGNQPYPQGPQQGPGTYNQANTGYFENEGNFNTGPIINQGGPNPPPNDQGNFYGQDQGGFPEGQQYNPNPGQGGYYPGQPGQPGMQQGGYAGEPFPGQDGGYNQANMGQGGQYPPQQGPQYNPQGNQQYGPVGDGGMLVNGQYQGPPQGSGAAGAAVAGGVAGGAAAGAAGFSYSTSSMYSTTTPIPPRTNTPGGPTTSPGFPYSTQNPNQPNFDPNQQPQSSVYPVIGSPAPGTSPYANQQGFPTTVNPNFEQGNYGPPSSIPPNQQGNMYTAQGTSYGPGNPPPNYQGNDDQFNQGQFTQGPNNQGQYNQGNIGYMPTSGNQQFTTTTFAPSPSGSPFPSSTTPFPQQTQMGPGSTPNNQGFQGSTTPFPPNYGPSSTSGNFQQTGNYPPGAQQDQAPTTLPPNVNVVGGGQAGPTTYQPGMSSSQGSLLGQNPSGSFVAGPTFQPTTTTVRPFYDTNNYAPGNMMTGGGFPQNQGGLSSTVYPPNYTPVAGGASGGAGYSPQFDFEHNMNTQYGHYNQSTSDLGPSRDAPQATQPTQSARSTGSLHLVLLAVLSLLFF